MVTGPSSLLVRRFRNTQFQGAEGKKLGACFGKLAVFLLSCLLRNCPRSPLGLTALRLLLRPAMSSASGEGSRCRASCRMTELMPQSQLRAGGQPTGHLSAAFWGTTHLCPRRLCCPMTELWEGRAGLARSPGGPGPPHPDPTVLLLRPTAPPPADQGGSPVSLDEEGTPWTSRTGAALVDFGRFWKLCPCRGCVTCHGLIVPLQTRPVTLLR